MTRKILMMTERRADYSKLGPIIKEITKSRKLDYQLVVTGIHFLRDHGYTVKEIRQDNARISAQFKMFSKNHGDLGSDMSYALGTALQELSKIIPRLKPDIVLSGFDTGAHLAAAIVGAHMNIPVGHLEAGDVTGNIDEPIRHSISKFAHFHFTTNTYATQRLVRMGESKGRIFTVGNPSLDNILATERMSKRDLAAEFKIDFDKPYLVMLQHPVVSEIDSTDQYFSETLKAIQELDMQTVAILGNSDAGSSKMLSVLKDSKIRFHKTVPFVKYVNLLRHASALVGNSSSGKMEAPFLHIPSVNIGTRQNGRKSAMSVIETKYKKHLIKKAIIKAVNDRAFHRKISRQKTFYGDGNSAKKIVKILERIDLDKIPIQKKLSWGQ